MITPMINNASVYTQANRPEGERWNVGRERTLVCIRIRRSNTKGGVERRGGVARVRRALAAA